MQGIVIEADALPEWLRTSYRDTDGTVYLPCAAFGNEWQVSLCLAHDNVRTVVGEGHVYAPSERLAREHPRWAREIRLAARRVRDARIGPATGWAISWERLHRYFQAMVLFDRGGNHHATALCLFINAGKKQGGEANATQFASGSPSAGDLGGSGAPGRC